MTSFGPNMAGLGAALAAGPGGSMGGAFGFDPFSAATLLALNNGNPANAAAAVASMTTKISDDKRPDGSPAIQPITPAEALQTIAAIATQSAKAGTLTASQVQNLGAIAKGIVQKAQKQAATGHPVAAYNAKVLDAAHRLSVAAGYVSRYVTPAAATMILKNAGYSGLPLGSGKYDRNLPLVLEQTVDRILYDPKSTTADLQLLAAALVQAA
jgi:hypothetical protein